MKVRLTVPVATRPAPLRADGAPPVPARPVVARATLLGVGRAAAGGALVAVAVAACSGGGSASSVPSIFTPSPHVTTSTASGGASRTPSPSTSGTGKSSATDTATSSARATATGAATPPATATHQPTATPSATAKATPRPTVTRYVTTTPTQYYPVGAPQTGGGGTAGLQDVTLFGAGGAAILAGFASLAYRRRLTRKRSPEADRHPTAPTHTKVP
jgi:hypothetical protein